LQIDEITQMSKHNTHDVVGHEETDADIAPLVKFAVFLTLLTLVTAALTAGFYKFLDRREQAEKAPRYPLAAGVERPLPPAPRLQTYPFDDVKGLRSEEARLLEHYSWIDKNAGTVRIPVSRAIELLAEKGLPHRVAPVPAGAPAVAPIAPAAPPAPAATHPPAH
jgi:hypothetical protein